MSRKILIGIGIVLVLTLCFLTYFFGFYTKSASPEGNVSFTDADLTITVFYNRPSKRGRTIFGGLVPYGKVWRTGANEATQLSTNKALVINGQVLKEGTYSVWTMPAEQSWKVFFNSKIPPWGINVQGEAAREPEFDVAGIDIVPVVQEKIFEQFTIALEKTGEEIHMIMMWDKTIVSVPISVSVQ